MSDARKERSRVFKTAWFAKAARKAGIKDDELCEAIREVMKGQGVDLGGGVFKKRLNRNMHRSIILAKTAGHWIYEYIFSKSKRDNIDADELQDFRKLVRAYSALTDQQLSKLLESKDLVEICDADEEI